MLSNKMMVLATALVVLLMLLLQSYFIVFEGQQGIVMPPGKATEPVGPGLHFKYPLVQEVIIVDNRLFEGGNESVTVQSKDNKSFIVTSQISWRVINPSLFIKTLGTVENAKSHVNKLVNEAWTASLGQHNLVDVISAAPTDISSEVTKSSSVSLASSGIQLVSLHIRTLEYSQADQKSVIEHMRAERKNLADQYRLEGKMEAEKVEAAARLERAAILAEAKERAELIRGQAKSTATEILINTAGSHPDLYELTKTLELYRMAFSNNSTMILSSDSEFLKFLKIN